MDASSISCIKAVCAKSNVALLRKATIIKPFRHMRMLNSVQFRKVATCGMVAALWLGLGLPAAAGADIRPDTSASTALDRGFTGLYNLDFNGAQKDFSAWQVQHPEDPVGPVSEAAGLLFSE